MDLLGGTQSAIRVVSRKTPRPMEHGQGAIGIGMAPDRHLHIMGAVPVGRDLQTPALIAHRIVVGHDLVFLDTKQIGILCNKNRTDDGLATYLLFCLRFALALDKVAHKLVKQGTRRIWQPRPAISN